MELDNCYYVPVVSRNIISISCLDMVGFSFIIKNNTCSIYYGDKFYGDTHNIANPLTKPLSQAKHESHIRSMGIRYMSD